MNSAAIGIILNETKTHVLLIKRNDVPVWVLPGGGVDAGETPEEAVLREITEETGLSSAINRKIGEYTPLIRLAQQTHVYECRVLGGKTTTGEETNDIGFFPIDTLPKHFFPLHEEWLRDALSNTPEVIHKPVNIGYLDVLKYLCLHPLWLIRFLLTRLGI